MDLSYIGLNLAAVNIFSDGVITVHSAHIVYVTGTGTWILHCAREWKVWLSVIATVDSLLI